MQRLMIVDTHGALGKAIERRLGDEFYIGVRCSDEMLAEEIRTLKSERIYEAMETVKLDTVYFLKGKETAE